MAGRVKTQLFKSGQDAMTSGGGRQNKPAEKATDKNELVFQRTFQQVVFAIILNLASSGILFIYSILHYIILLFIIIV
jgi:hypothetical protein